MITGDSRTSMISNFKLKNMSSLTSAELIYTVLDKWTNKSLIIFVNLFKNQL